MSESPELQKEQTGTEEINESALSDLLKDNFKPITDEAETAIETAVQTLAQQAVAGAATISDDVVKTIKQMITQIDEQLTNQINEIIHHPEYQQLESAWRGLHYLVNNTESDEFLKIRFMNISKKELQKNLRRYKGVSWDQSPIFKKVYEHEYGVLGGEPYGCLVGDYYFDHTAPDVEMLGEIAKISASAHAPFLSAVSPSALRLESWQELPNPRDVTKIFSTPEHAAWNSLRNSEDSKYLGLTMPRFLARQPYGANSNPVDEFAFEEDTADANHNRYAWSNSAYAMAVNINRAFKEWGWCSRIRGVESGGLVENLPTHTFPTDDGGVDMKCPTEISISDRRELELSKAGFLPLIHRKNTDMAAFIGGQSFHKPAVYDDPDATANANLSARLPYLFASSRFAHYLKCMVRDKIGGAKFSGPEEMQRWLQDWIMNYVEGDPVNAGEAAKAERPLSAAEVVVEEIEGNPGMYSSKFYLRPHYQLEGLTVSLRLVSKLPSERGN